MPTKTRSERGETHISNLAGAVRRITGVPYLTFVDATDPSENNIGSICYSTDLERLYVNVGSTQYTWRYLSLT